MYKVHSYENIVFGGRNTGISSRINISSPHLLYFDGTECCILIRIYLYSVNSPGIKVTCL